MADVWILGGTGRVGRGVADALADSGDSPSSWAGTPAGCGTRPADAGTGRTSPRPWRR
ncbi:MAG: hypothetical protein ACRYG2_23830 [Janthinobacterium lividum]